MDKIMEDYVFNIGATKNGTTMSEKYPFNTNGVRYIVKPNSKFKRSM